MFWEWADSVMVDAGETGGALETSADRHPGVSDSIELHNGMQATRRATTKALGKVKHPSMTTNVKRGGQMAASRVMGTGTPPQAVSDEVG